MCRYIIVVSALLVSVCSFGSEPSSDSLFIRNYQTFFNKQVYRLSRKVRSVSRDYRNTNDTLILIPTIVFDKRIEWHYYDEKSVSSHNAQYANWKSFVLSHMYLDDFLLKNNRNIQYIENGGFQKKPIFHIVEPGHYGGAYIVLCQEIEKMQPEYIFRIAGIEAWFCIVGGRIIAFERDYGTIVYHENAIAYLKKVFSNDNFWPIFDLP